MIIAVTTGEPAGIGPEVALRAALQCAASKEFEQVRVVLLGDAGLLAQRARAAGVVAPLHAYKADSKPAAGSLEVLDCPLTVPALAGKLDARNGAAVLAMLDRSIAGALSGEFDAVVTAPLQKSTINDAGYAFTGHTEYFAEKTHTPRVVMMLAGGGLRVALATTHLALRDVPAAITHASLSASLKILDADLREKFGIAAPRILVTGLNPHAGEGGYLGREEIDIIEPALRELREAGIDVQGPFPADTLFQPKYLQHCDAVFAMYHDQGLPVLKHASFGQGVNITLGLPIIRTSVDHGTALDLAGTGKADAGSMLAALQVAREMASHRMGKQHQQSAQTHVQAAVQTSAQQPATQSTAQPATQSATQSTAQSGGKP